MRGLVTLFIEPPSYMLNLLDTTLMFSKVTILLTADIQTIFLA
jgi:hypothetical protein